MMPVLTPRDLARGIAAGGQYVIEQQGDVIVLRRSQIYRLLGVVYAFLTAMR